MSDPILKKIIARLDRLEAEVFGRKRGRAGRKAEEYKGAKGGILLLVSKNFLAKRRTAQEVKKEMEKDGYDYRIAVVQTALNRLSIKTGPLTVSSEGGKKAYVKRK